MVRVKGRTEFAKRCLTWANDPARTVACGAENLIKDRFRIFSPRTCSPNPSLDGNRNPNPNILFPTNSQAAAIMLYTKVR